MKRVIMLSVFALMVSFLLQANDGIVVKINEAIAKFSWEKTTHDFGKIEKKKPVTAVFEFTNDGEKTLVISKVKGSCGCTVTDYSKTSIAPGKTGFVKATYNAAAVGAFMKTVTVTANTGGKPVQLFIKGEVLK